MILNFYKVVPLVAVFIVVLSLTACVALGGTSSPTHFYTLSVEPVDKTDDHHALSELTSELSIDIHLVELPDILERPQIVTRIDKNRIKLGDFDQWAGDLKTDMAHTIVNELKKSLNTDRVFIFPRLTNKPVSYQVKINVIQFDGVLGGNTVLRGSWALFRGLNNKELVYEDFSLRVAASGENYIDTVSALSDLLVMLAEKIAQSILDFETSIS